MHLLIEDIFDPATQNFAFDPVLPSLKNRIMSFSQLKILSQCFKSLRIEPILHKSSGFLGQNGLRTAAISEKPLESLLLQCKAMDAS